MVLRQWYVSTVPRPREHGVTGHHHRSSARSGTVDPAAVLDRLRHLSTREAESALADVRDRTVLSASLRNLATDRDVRDIEVLRVLVRCGAAVNGTDAVGATAMHLAALSGSPRAIDVLASVGADVLAPLPKDARLVRRAGGRPSLVASYTPLHLAASANQDPDVVRALVRHGAPIDAPLAKSYEQGYTPLHLALQINGNPDVARALLDMGADVHAGPAHGMLPPMFLAAGIGFEKLSIVRDAGGDPRGQFAGGNSCLHFAVMSGDPRCVRAVAAMGVDPELRDERGMTALHTWFETTSAAPQPDDVRFSMIEAFAAIGADMESRDDQGKTALHLALERNDLVMAQTLIDHGADLDTTDPTGATPAARIEREQLTLRLPMARNAVSDVAPALIAIPAAPTSDDDPTSPNAGTSGVTEPIAPFDVRVDAHPEVTYAFAHNRVPVIRRLSIALVREPARGLLDVSVRLVWSREAKSPAKEVRFTIECPPFGAPPVVIDDVGLRLDDTVMVDLEEAVPARIEIEVSASDGTTQRLEHGLRLLARNQWAYRTEYPELLAAFVQPNHPMVRDITAEAAKRLQAATGSASLEGYQSGPERARAIGAAVFEALQARSLRYVNPPASFEASQKVRPLDEVLEAGAGTCIDLACAYASCLQAAGLHPLIWIVNGHAFGGFHTAPEYLDVNAIVDANAMITMRDAGIVVPVETVALTNGKTFTAAVEDTRSRYVHTDLRMMLDVERSHRTGTLPLPARVVRGDVVEVVIDPGPDRAVIYERRDRNTGKRVAKMVPPRVERWKSRLLDLSKRNPLIKFSTKRAGLDLLVPTGLLATVERDLSGGRGVLVYPGDRLEGADSAAGLRSAADLHANDLRSRYGALGFLYAPSGTDEARKRVRALVARGRLLESETGANSLYIVLGTLTWRDRDGDEMVSPLFLLPVRVQADRGAGLMRMEADANGFTTPNYCLLEKLKVSYRLDVPEFENPAEGASGIDVETALQSLRHAIHDRRLPFRVDETAHLAVLQFSKFRLWRDLVDHWEEFAKNPVVRHLIEHPGVRFQDPAADTSAPTAASELSNTCPLPADGTQLKTIERAAAGHSFVIEGPPGTGKSQTIANLLANALTQGRRVLFVAEKQAALSVVKRRLAQVGLDPYCLDLHDKGSSHDVIRKQLRDALEERPYADLAEFERHEQALTHLHERLASYHGALHAENALGESYASAYERLLEIGQEPPTWVSPEYLSRPGSDHERARQVVLDLEVATRAAHVGPDHPWRMVWSLRFAEVDRQELARAVDGVERTVAALEALPDTVRRATHQTVASDQFLAIADLLDLKRERRLPSEAVLEAASEPRWLESVEAALASIWKTMDGASRLVHGGPLDWLSMSETHFVAAGRSVQEASRSFVIGRRRRMGAALAALVAPDHVRDYGAKEAEALVSSMARYREKLTTASGRLGDVAPFLSASFDDLSHETACLDALRQARAAARIAEHLSQRTPLAIELRRLRATESLTVPAGTADGLRRFAEALTTLWAVLAVPEQAVFDWVADETLEARLEVVVPRWRQDRMEERFLQLQRWTVVANGLEELCALGLEDFATGIAHGAFAPEDLSLTLRRGELQCVLRERSEAKHLDDFDRHQHDAAVARFVEALDQRREALMQVIPARLSAARTIDPDIAFGAVAELRVELQRQRGARSVRRLIERFGGVVQQLTPCFLMSPDSVAKFLPAGSVAFDLVVFDEASQIDVAEAIGAMGRAQSVVVVGDSKQMPPSRFAEVGSDEDWDVVEDESAEDAESLLIEAVEAGLDREWLSWHYRSRDESLIAFSNAHYYEGRLSSFPHPGEGAVPAVSWRNVHGQFDHGRRRVNEIEAQAVVDEVVRRLDVAPTASIGVVTLNVQQRNEVLERLEALGHPIIAEQLGSDDPDALFVRNLENVQGDERDVIILSTGFSKPRSGGPMPLRFGPLNRAGGERRLNVAVTRARQEVMIVSSFEPEEIDERRATALGLLHLREYLRAARDGARPIDDTPASKGRRSMLRDAIARSLQERGLRVAADVGLSPFRVDLAASRPGTTSWHVAVLLDDWRWRERATVGDRDALPVNVLERAMGWPSVVRVWTPAWRREADAIVDEIVTRVDAAIEREHAEPPGRIPIAIDRGVTMDVPGPDASSFNETAPDSLGLRHSERIAPAAPERAYFGDSAAAATSRLAPESNSPTDAWERMGATVFEPYPDEPLLGTPDDCDPTSVGKDRLKRAVAEAIAWESPIEAMRLARLVARRLHVKKLHAKRAAHILWHLPKGAKMVKTPFGRFVWGAEQDPAAYAAFRIEVETPVRKLEEVAPEEVGNLLHAIVRAAGHIDRDELYQTALSAVGIARLTTGFRRRLDGIVDTAVRAERLALDADGRLELGTRHASFPVAPPKPAPAGTPAPTQVPPQRVPPDHVRHDLGPPPTLRLDPVPPSAPAKQAARPGAELEMAVRRAFEAIVEERGLEHCGNEWFETLVLTALALEAPADESADVDPAEALLQALEEERRNGFAALKRFVRAHGSWLGDGEAVRSMVKLMTALGRLVPRLRNGGEACAETVATHAMLRDGRTLAPTQTSEPRTQPGDTAIPGILKRADVTMRRLVAECAKQGVELKSFDRSDPDAYVYVEGELSVVVSPVAHEGLPVDGRAALSIRLLTGFPLRPNVSDLEHTRTFDQLNEGFAFTSVMRDDGQFYVSHEVPIGGGTIVENFVTTLKLFASTTRLAAARLGVGR